MQRNIEPQVVLQDKPLELLEEKESRLLMDAALRNHAELSKSKIIDHSYKLISKSLLEPAPDSESPWRDRFISGAAHIVTTQILALIAPESVPVYIAEIGAESFLKGTPPLKSAISKVAKDEEAQAWWNHQVTLTGEGPSFQGAVSLAKLGVKLSSLPGQLLHSVRNAIEHNLKHLLDLAGITDKSVASIATGTLEFLARNSPELLEEQAWSMAFVSKDKSISNIPPADHKKETLQYCENIQKRWNEKFEIIKRNIPKKLAVQSKPQPEIEKLTASLREEASALLDMVKAHVKSNSALMAAEKMPSAERHAKVQLEIQKSRFEEYIFMRSTFADLCEGASHVISMMGDNYTAQKIATFGSATVKLLDSVYMLANGTTVVSPLLSSSSMLSPIAPYVGILSAGASFFSLLNHKKKKDHSLEILVSEMQRIAQVLLNQIAILHKDMMIRFNQLEKQVSILQKHMMHGFMFLEKELLDFKVPVLYSLSRIEDEMKTLQIINSKVDALLLKAFTKSCADIESYPSRYGDLDAMPEKEFLKHAKTLENTLLGMSPSHIYMNGAFITDNSPVTLNRTLTSAKPEVIVGLLATLAQQEFKCSLPKKIVTSELPNLMIYIVGTDRYLTLRENLITKEYDQKSIQLHKIAEAGENMIEFLNFIQTNKNLFEKLIARYKSAQEKVSVLCSKAMQNKSNEIAELVHNTGLSLRKATIEDAKCPLDPIYKKFGIEYTKELLKHSDYNLSELNRIWRINLEWPAAKTLHHLPGRAYVGERISLHSFVHPQEAWKQSLPILKLGNGTLMLSTAEALFAERLGLGYIDYEYSIQDRRLDLPYNAGIDGHGPVEFNMRVSFKKNSDKSSIYLYDEKYLGMTDGNFVGAMQYQPPPVQILNSAQFSSLTTQERCTALRHSAWLNRRSIGWDHFLKRGTDNYTNNLNGLGSLVNVELVKRRKEAIATLYQASASGTEYQQALEELDLASHLLQAFCYLAGFDPKEMEKLNLLSKDKIISHQQAYLSSSPAESSAWFPASGDVSTLMTRFNKPLPPNPFVTMIEVQLARLGLLAVQSIDAQAEQDQSRQIKEESERKSEQKIDDAVLKKLDLAQLTIDKQNEQIAAMAAVITEMQKQQEMMFQMMMQQLPGSVKPVAVPEGRGISLTR